MYVCRLTQDVDMITRTRKWEAGKMTWVNNNHNSQKKKKKDDMI